MITSPVFFVLLILTRRGRLAGIYDARCSGALPVDAGFTHMHICELCVTFATLAHTRSQPYACAYVFFFQSNDPLLGQRKVARVSYMPASRLFL